MPDEPTTYRILVIANETCPCPALLDELAELAAVHDTHRVYLVAPALNSRLKHYVSDTDGALAAAQERLARAVSYLGEKGVAAEGTVGDADPFVAVGDALHDVAADEIILSTHPPERSHWLERNLVERVTATTDVPVHHVISKYGLTLT